MIEIRTALASAKIAVLLVTPNFLASDFIQSTELPDILESAKEGGLTIVWVAVSSSSVHRSPINDYQCANTPSNPLDSLPESEQNAVFVQVSDQIVDAMQR